MVYVKPIIQFYWYYTNVTFKKVKYYAFIELSYI